MPKWRRKVHAALRHRREERLLHRAVDAVAEGVLVTDLQGHSTFCNQAAAELLGRSRESLLGTDVHRLLHSGEVPGDCPVEAAMRGEIAASHPIGSANGSGISSGVRCRAAPVLHDGRVDAVVITLVDATAERQGEQAKRLADLGRLAGTVAHEFNNVLMGIHPLAEMIILKGGSESTTRAARYILSAVERGKRITQDILRFTQSATPMRSPFEVASWLRTVREEARSVLPANVSVETNAPNDLFINGDVSQLSQVFFNLVFNARDAMPEGGAITIDVRREPVTTRFPLDATNASEGVAHLIFCDTGHGMSAETLRHAFEPLFTTKRSGTGLGLAVAHQIIMSHGGAISIESAPNTGTTFHILLPLIAPEVHHEHPAVVGSGSLIPPPLSVLLVEDEPSVAMGIQGVLESRGYTVNVAPTGQNAIDAARTTEYDVVILDIGLPDIDGREVYDAIIDFRPDLPFIVSTAYAPGLGGNRRPSAHLVKPYDADTLLRAIRDALQS